MAWLEALAAQGLDDEAALSAAGGGTAGRFGAREGVWAETRLRLAAGIARSGDQPLVRVQELQAVIGDAMVCKSGVSAPHAV